MILQDGEDLPPPGYKQSARSTAKELLPHYSDGSRTYVIAKNTLNSPLVSVAQVKAHLCLLREIQALRALIELGKDMRIPSNVLVLPPVQRWAWFVGVAVER